MAIQVYHEPLCRRYYASRASCAYLFYVFTTFVLLSLPFFLAYTGVPAFWLRTATLRDAGRPPWCAPGGGAGTIVTPGRGVAPGRERRAEFGRFASSTPM